jgi:AcrR family transcriptional regulator
MPPLPAPLAESLSAGSAGAGKRERTRRQLLQAAIHVFATRGVAGAAVQEIAAVAGVANGTVYNHFSTKEEVVQAVALWLADTLCRRISDSYGAVRDGAERMAIGNRRYLWLAEVSPAWALLLLDVAAAAPLLLEQVQQYALADLRLGIRQKSFRQGSEAAAMDLINGTVMHAMRRIAFGLAPPGHASAVAATVLRGLGLTHEEALAVAKRPLPEFAPLAAAAASARPARTARPR